MTTQSPSRNAELPHFAAPRRAKSSDEWYTPESLVNALGPFDLDPATSLQRGRQLAPQYFTVKEDGLTQKWRGRVWLNPPFSRIHPWIERMREHNDGVLLCFSRTDANWFVDLTRFCGGVFLLQRRMQFWRPEQRAQRCPLGVVLFPFGPRNMEAIERSGIAGVLLRSTPTDIPMKAYRSSPVPDATQSRPSPARAGKVMESGGQPTTQPAAQTGKTGRIEAPAGTPVPVCTPIEMADLWSVLFNVHKGGIHPVRWGTRGGQLLSREVIEGLATHYLSANSGFLSSIDSIMPVPGGAR